MAGRRPRLTPFPFARPSRAAPWPVVSPEEAAGLVVPHAMRLLIGASHARLLPLSALGGALFMVIADTIARTAFGAVVVQTGVVAALIGAPVFLILLLRKRAHA